jgi:hypothetical protein
MESPGKPTLIGPRRALRSRRGVVVALIALVCVLMSVNGFVVRYSEGGVQDAPSLGRAVLLSCEPWIPWLLLAVPLAWLFTAVTVLRGSFRRFLLVHGLMASAIAGGLAWGWDGITEPLLRSVRRDAMLDLLRGAIPDGVFAEFQKMPLTGERAAAGFVSVEIAAATEEHGDVPVLGLAFDDPESGGAQVYASTEGAPVDGVQFWSSNSLDFLPALSTHFLAYLVLLALAQGLLFYREMTRGREETALMQARYDRMRLDSLRSHIDPHFLYNVLTAISSMSREDGAVARQMIGDLSSLMRASSAREGSLRCTLKEELELATRYVNLIRRRFKGRFELELDIDDEALECLVPAWTLQPLLENVVVHGVHDTKHTVTATVEASVANDHLLLVVRDDAPLSSGASGHLGGTALANLRERLEALFGPTASLEAAPGSDRGFRTTIGVPQAFEGEDPR